MPNWNENTLSITGLTDQQETELLTHFNEGKLMSHYVPEPDWATIPNEEGELPEPKTQTWENGSSHTFLAFPSTGKQDQRWWDWRLKNWGCKWDFGHNPDFDEPAEQADTINFLTPWGPPLQGLENLSAVYPEATFTLTYQEEGMDFAGVAFFHKGEGINKDLTTPMDFKTNWLKENAPELMEQVVEEDWWDDEIADQLEDKWDMEGGIDCWYQYLDGEAGQLLYVNTKQKEVVAA